MSRVFRDIDSIRDVLEASIGSRVTVILSSGRIINAEVENIEDDLLIASVGNRLISINVERIDAVVSRCEGIFQSIIDRRDSLRDYSRSRYVSREREISDYSLRRSTVLNDDQNSIAYESISNLDSDGIRMFESRRHDYWDSRRSSNSQRNNLLNGSSGCGYIRHDENVERYFY